MSDAPVLEVDAASRSFGATRALDGAGLNLARGEWLGLLGPNGAGKTTLVRAIAGRVKLDSGRLRLLGQDLTPGDTHARRQLGVIPQEIALFPELTARENLEVFAALHGVAADQRQERSRWALAWTGLDERAEDRAGTFSGGMKRRLNIACGVLHQPEVILLDEPTVGVDPQSRHRIWEMLDTLRKNGASLVLTTHQLDEAQEVTDRIVIIDHGKTIATGTFPELVKKTIGPGHLVTITFEEDAPSVLAEQGFDLCGAAARRSATHLAEELPALLRDVESAGGTVVDLHVQSPTLQSVFIHLTGRELRE